MLFILLSSLLTFSTPDTVVSKNEDCLVDKLAKSNSIELKLINRGIPIPISYANILVFSSDNQFEHFKADLNGTTTFITKSNCDSLTISISAPGYIGIKTKIQNKSGNFIFCIPYFNSDSNLIASVRKFPFYTDYTILAQSEFPYFRFRVDSMCYFPFGPNYVSYLEYIKDTFPHKFVPRPNNWPQNSIRILCNSTNKDIYSDYPMMSQYKSIHIFNSLEK